jgi:hypothetical protein
MCGVYARATHADIGTVGNLRRVSLTHRGCRGVEWRSSIRGRAMQYVAGGILEHAAKAEVRRSRVHEGQEMIPRRSGNAAQGLSPMRNSKSPRLQVDRARRSNGGIDQIYQNVRLHRSRRIAAYRPPVIERFDEFHVLNSQM